MAQSDVVALALRRFGATYRSGKVALGPLKARAHSLRVSWMLRLPADWAEVRQPARGLRQRSGAIRCR